jgi:3-oxoacyl-[acyl-carrier protein] reductase
LPGAGLVTGAARGIGAAIAETLARDGAEVTCSTCPRRKDLDALAERLGGRALALDICAADAAAQLVEALPDGIDIVVHNAGITRDKTLANMTPEYWDAVLAVNLKAPQVLTRRCSTAASCTMAHASPCWPRSAASPATAARPTTRRARPG